MAVARSSTFSGEYAWRIRAAVVVDMVFGVALLVILGFAVSPLDVLLGYIVPSQAQRGITQAVLVWAVTSFIVRLAAVVLLARLAARGRTPGLALAGLCWRDEAGRPAWRRLLGEPQFWCAVLPTMWVLCMLPGDAARLFVAYDPFWAATSTFDNVIGPILVLGALACMAVSRRRPGRLASCR